MNKMYKPFQRRKLMKGRSGFLKNTAVLFGAMLITKIIGAVLKIPLTNMMGGTGMGYFSTAYSFFNPVYTVLAAGLPTVVTRMTAQSAAVKRFKDARKIKSGAIILSLISGILGMAFMILLSRPFADYAASSPESLWAVLAISPSVLFCCLAAAYRGYYEGLSNMFPTAVSQVVESVVKAVLGLGLSALVMSLGESGKIPPENVLPLSAAAAVAGVTIGELCGTLFLMLRSRLGSDFITEKMLKDSPAPQGKREIAKKIILQALPISAGAVIINLGAFIDLLTISSGIQECFVRNSEYFLTHWGAAVAESGADYFGNFVYGSYSGIVLSIFMLVTSITALIGKSALPEIASAYERKDKNEICRKVSILISGIFLMGLPACMCLGALAEPALNILYPVREAEVSVSVIPLVILCGGGIPIALCGGLFSVFQAAGRFDLPIKLMMCGSAAKLIMNLLFLRIPVLSVSGAALSTVISHILVMILGIVSLRSAIGARIKIFTLFVKPFAASVACCLAALLSYYMLFNNFGSILRMLLTVCGGGLVYILLILMLDKRIIGELKRKKHLPVQPRSSFHNIARH